MKKHIILTGLIISLVYLFISGCSEEVSFDPENIMQVKNAGLREGVFERRYKLTSEYGKHQVFTPEILKGFITEKLEPDYLFIANAYELGLHNDDILQQKIRDYRINLIANNHPINYENLSISKEKLQDLYQKKSVQYDIDLVQANSYGMADSMYKFISAGNKIVSLKLEETNAFLKHFHFNSLTYGTKLHPNILPKLTELKEGQVSEPVFTNPTWSIIRLNRKTNNTGLRSYDAMVNELIQQLEALIKFENNKQLINDLREKYPVSINKDQYQIMISAITSESNHSWIDKNKINRSELNDTFLNINNDEISLSNFISSFNKAMQFVILPILTGEDLEMFAETYINQNLLYLDAIQKDADLDVLLKDKLHNYVNKLLLSKYLKEEIARKIIVSDTDAREHYNNNRDKWNAEYSKISKTVVNDLRKKRLYERRDDLVNKLKKEYNVRYNETMLMRLAKQLTMEKKSGKGNNQIEQKPAKSDYPL